MTLSLVKAWAMAQSRLKDARLDSPAIDARLLLEAATGASRMDILTDPYRELSDDQIKTLEDYLNQRLARKPVSRILGRKGFWKVMLKVNEHVLSPRPETENLVDLGLGLLPEGQAASVLDLGVGSGAILLSILAERPAAKGLGIDASEEALAVARENAANLGLEGRTALLHGNWTYGLADESFDLALSNPPYIPSSHISGLDPEVREHDPLMALDGGEDGLDPYRLLAPEMFRVLKKGAHFGVEIGFDQSKAVEALFTAAGFLEVRTLKDLSTLDRVVTGFKPT